MYTTPISRNIAGRHGGPLPSKSFADVLKLAANAYSKPASDPHYRVETSDQQLTHGVRISSTLLSNVGWESCTISTTTTFANEGDGSAVGEIHLGSYRHLMYPVYPGEARLLSNTGVRGAMGSLPSYVSVYNKAAQQQLAIALKAKQQMGPCAMQEAPFLAEDVFANMGYDFVLVEAGGTQRLMAEFLGDVAEMGADPDVGEAIRKEAKARGGLGLTDTMDVELVAATGTAIMVTFKSGNRIYAVLGAVIDCRGRLLIGMCKAAKDTNFCDVGSIRKMLRKAAYPLPTGDCDQSLIRLQYLAGDGRPGSTTVYLMPRKAKDIKKHPTGRGPTARVKRNNLGSSQATPAQGDMSDLPGSDSACVMNSSRHKTPSAAVVIHPLSLGNERRHVLQRYEEYDELASSAPLAAIAEEKRPVAGGVVPEAVQALHGAGWAARHAPVKLDANKANAQSPRTAGDAQTTTPPRSVRHEVADKSPALSDAQGRKKPFRFPDAEAENEIAQRIAREHFDHEYQMSKTRKDSPRHRAQSKPAQSPARISSDIAQSANGPRQNRGSEVQGGKGNTQSAKAKDWRVKVEKAERASAPIASSQRLSDIQRGTQSSSDLEASKRIPTSHRSHQASDAGKPGPQL